MMMWTVCMIVLVTVAWTTDAGNPGFKARITSKGLNYANDKAMEALKDSVNGLKIPDQGGSHYSVENIRITEFSPPSSVIKTKPGTGLVWTANNAYIAVKGNFHYKKLFLKLSGSFDAKVSGVDFNLDFVIGSDSQGRPTMSTKSCNNHIGDVNFHFHGGAAWIYNLFRHQVEGAIKNLLNGQLCTLIRKEVDVDGAKKLAKLKVTTKLGKDYLLDYSLSKAPVFTPGYLETFHKGEIYWQAKQTEAPMPVPVLPDSGDSDHMIFLWVSDYMANTMMYNSQIHNVLKYNLSKDDISPSQRGALNTSCTGLIPKCVGRLIPGISQMYPNSVVELHMNSTKVPKMSISPSAIAMEFEGIIDMYAHLTDKPLAFLVSLDAKMSLKINASVANELLYAKINDLSVTLKTLKSSVGPVSDESLNFIVKEVLSIFLVPKLNELGKKGFPLPMTDDFKFQNTKLTLAQNSLILAADIQYTPSMNNDDNTLRFKPANRHV